MTPVDSFEDLLRDELRSAAESSATDVGVTAIDIAERYAAQRRRALTRRSVIGLAASAAVAVTLWTVAGAGRDETLPAHHVPTVLISNQAPLQSPPPEAGFPVGVEWSEQTSTATFFATRDGRQVVLGVIHAGTVGGLTKTGPGLPPMILTVLPRDVQRQWFPPRAFPNLDTSYGGSVELPGTGFEVEAIGVRTTAELDRTGGIYWAAPRHGAVFSDGSDVAIATVSRSNGMAHRVFYNTANGIVGLSDTFGDATAPATCCVGNFGGVPVPPGATAAWTSFDSRSASGMNTETDLSVYGILPAGARADGLLRRGVLVRDLRLQTAPLPGTDRLALGATSRSIAKSTEVPLDSPPDLPDTLTWTSADGAHHSTPMTSS